MANSLKIRYWFTEVVAALFVLLFLYTAISKLRNISQFEESMRNAPIIHDYASVLSWIIPTSEIITTIALIIPSTRYTGLVMSVVLMVLFTGYIGYMLSTMSHLPCRCGGIIEAMNWQQHLWFNITFLLLGIAGVFLARKDIIMINGSSRTPVKIVGKYSSIKKSVMKKIMLVTLTAVFAICFSAFTFKNHQSAAKPSFDPEYWYELNAGADPTNPANYFLVGGDGQSEPSCVLTTGFRCAIKTEKQGPIVNPLHPDYPDLGTISEERKRNTQ